MTDSRQQALFRWAVQQVDAEEEATWQPVSGDASSRCYFRLNQRGKRPLIAMDSSLEKESLQQFVDIAQRLRDAGLHAPSLENIDLDRGFALLEDLGDKILRTELEPLAGDTLFQDILPVLLSMAGRAVDDGLPDYSATKLLGELQLFPDWYAHRHLQQPFTEQEDSTWRYLCDELLASAMSQDQVFVHRDFHSCNLHRLGDGGIGIIDFQDAVRGPVSYDLVSWLWDRYIDWPRDALERWMLQYRTELLAFYPDQCQGLKQLTSSQWIRCCDLMGLQRNLKIVGIFSRLNYRDGKAGYLEMIPRFATYIKGVLRRYDEFSAVYPILEKRL